MGFKNMEGFGGQATDGDSYGIFRHDSAEWALADLRIFLKASDEISVGVDSSHFPSCIQNDGCSASFGGDFRQGFVHGCFRAANGHRSAGSHNFTDGQEQISANGSSGMETGKIFAAESAAFKEYHGKGIPHRQHGGGTGGRREIEWTGFLLTETSRATSD